MFRQAVMRECHVIGDSQEFPGMTDIPDDKAGTQQGCYSGEQRPPDGLWADRLRD